MCFGELKKIICVLFLCNNMALFSMEDEKPIFMLSLKQFCKKVVLDHCQPEEVITTLPNALVDELSDYATTISKGLLVSKELSSGRLGYGQRNGKVFDLYYEKSYDDNWRHKNYVFYENDSSAEVIKNTICFNNRNDDKKMLKRAALFADKSDLIQKIYKAIIEKAKHSRHLLPSLDITEPLKILKLYKLTEYCATPSNTMVNLDYLHGLFEGHCDEKNTSCLQWQAKNLIALSGLRSLDGPFHLTSSVYIEEDEENNEKEKSEITGDNKNWLPYFIKLHTTAFCYGLSFDRKSDVKEVDFKGSMPLSKNLFIVKAFLMPYISNLFFKQKQARRIEKDKDPNCEPGIPSVGVSKAGNLSKTFDTFDGTKRIKFYMTFTHGGRSYAYTSYAPLRSLTTLYIKNKLSRQNSYEGALHLFELDYLNFTELFKKLQQESNKYKIATIHSLYDAMSNKLSGVPHIDVNFSDDEAQVLVNKIKEIIAQEEYELILPEDEDCNLKIGNRETAENRDLAIMKIVREHFPPKINAPIENRKCFIQ